MTTLTFQNTELSVINHNNQIWLTTSEVGKALGYSNPLKAIATLFERHQDEFTPCMTALVDLQTAGGMQKVRIFSLRGCHLIGMLSHTKVAKDFRKWVLDILDKEVSQNNQRNLPLVEEKKYTLELTEYELRKLCWLWKMAEIMRSLLYILYEPLNALGSRHSGAAYGYSREYQFSIEESRKILLRATADIQPHKFDADWNRVLPELRKGKVNNY